MINKIDSEWSSAIQCILMSSISRRSKRRVRKHFCISISPSDLLTKSLVMGLKVLLSTPSIFWKKRVFHVKSFQLYCHPAFITIFTAHPEVVIIGHDGSYPTMQFRTTQVKVEFRVFLGIQSSISHYL